MSVAPLLERARYALETRKDCAAMDNKHKPQGSQQLEGEGSYSATRKYNSDLLRALTKSNLGAAAEEARKAIEGPEGRELKKAERFAKRGRPLMRRRPAQHS
ncbi:MAG TPA: hypothetical protein VGP93_20820 [Polyangiaceae bacterium]|nr:hypothetical protein [Polyangiaceae bacterium]